MEPGTWKAIAAPFGITTEADSCEEAKQKIEELTDLYVEGLKEHNFPEHLINRDFADAEDKKVLELLWADMTKNVAVAKNQGSFQGFARHRQQASRSATQVPYYQLQFA